jgi:iron complex outermembrane recepter protein
MTSVQIQTWIAGWALFGIALTAQAQQLSGSEPTADADTRLQEITVTATRREGRVQDVPVAVTAMDGDSLRNLGITSSEDLQYVAPGLQTQGGFSNTSPQWNIRGVGSNGFFANDVGGVGIYLDDVFLNSNVGQGFQLFDTERVEVLRGPQGTLFGANTTGGAIQFISRRPSGETGASASVTLGNYSTRMFEAAGEVALSESTALRVAVLTNENDGYFRNLTTGVRDGVTDIRSYRATLTHRFTDAADATIRVWGGDSTGDELVNFQQGTFDRANPAAGVVCAQASIDAELCVDRTGYSESQKYSDFYDHEAETPATSDVRSRGASATLAWKFDSVDLTSITAWYQASRTMIDDIDGSADVFSSEQWNSSSDQYTQELRLSSSSSPSSLQWVGGVFLMREDAADSYLFNFIPDGLWRVYDSEASSASIFGQLDYSFTPALSLTAGARYSYDKREFSNFRADLLDQSNYQPGVFLTRQQMLDLVVAPLLVPTAVEDNWSAVSGRLSLNWRLSSDVLAYFSAARGYRAGNFNGGAFSLGELTAVDPEYATTGEIGFKSEFLDGRARLNVAAFFSDYSDLQVVTFSGRQTILGNAADATIKGGELEFSYKPIRELLVSFNASFLRAKYDTFLSAKGDFSGNELENSPHRSFQTIGSYDVPIAGDKRLRLQLDAAYKGEVFQDFSNKLASIQDGYWLLGARVGYGSADDRYEISVWGRNLTDTEYRRNWFDVGSAGFNGINKGTPRTYGVTFSIRL